MTGRPRVPPADGQSLVEFALVFPVFLLLLFGLIDIGRFVYTANAVSEAAREGARFGSVVANCGTNREACVEAETHDRLAAVAGATVTAGCTRYVVTQARWVPATGGCQTNDLLKVEVSTRFQVLTPIVGQLLGGALIQGSSQVTVNQ